MSYKGIEEPRYREAHRMGFRVYGPSQESVVKTQKHINPTLFVPQRSRTPQGIYKRYGFTVLFWLVALLVIVGCIVIRIILIGPLFG